MNQNPWWTPIKFPERWTNWDKRRTKRIQKAFAKANGYLVNRQGPRRRCNLSAGQRRLFHRLMRGETVSRGPRRAGSSTVLLHVLLELHRLHPDWKLGTNDLGYPGTPHRQYSAMYIDLENALGDWLFEIEDRKACDRFFEIDWDYSKWHIRVTGRGGTRIRLE